MRNDVKFWLETTRKT